MIVFAILLEIIVLFVIRLITGYDSIDGNILVLFNMIIFGIWIGGNKKLTKNQKIILFTSFYIMSILALIDNFINLPYRTGDVEDFHLVATNVSNDLSLLNEKIYCAPYTKIIGIIYYLIGVNSTFIININIILMTISVYNVFIIINKLRIRENIIIELILAFLPQSLLLSCSLLREAIIIYFITLSLKKCIDYITKGKKINMFIGILYVMVASTFHSGVLFLIIGYIFILGFYDFKKHESKLTPKKAVGFGLTILVLIVIYNNYSNVIGGRFNVDLNKVGQSIGSNSGGSAYLKGVKTSGIDGLLIYMIPKTICFLFSPMPWDWRGITDIIAFCTDSIIYIYLIHTIIKYNKGIKKEYRFFINAISLGVLLGIIVYSLGTGNSGTAMRHRHKFLTFLAFIAIVSKSDSNSIEDNLRNNNKRILKK